MCTGKCCTASIYGVKVFVRHPKVFSALIIVYHATPQKNVNLQFHKRKSREELFVFNYPDLSVTNYASWRDHQKWCAVCSQWALFPRLMSRVSSWTFYIKPQWGNLMLNSDAPSAARLKSQPEPSTEAKLEHRHPFVNRSGELIYFSRQTGRCTMDQRVCADKDPRRHLACSCTCRTLRNSSEIYKQAAKLCPEPFCPATISSNQRQEPLKVNSPARVVPTNESILKSSSSQTV